MFSRLHRPLQWSWLIPRLFFLGVVLLGVLLFRDYGLSWDEPTDHLNGQVNVKYVAELLLPARARQEGAYHELPPLAGFSENDHGPLFAMPVALLGRLFTHSNPRSYYFMQHLINYLVCVVGMWALFRIGLIRFRDWRWALLGSVLLLLSPRFFAESFYNSKDLIFVALFTLAMYTLVRLLARPTWGRAVVHGLATAAAIDVRILGILLLGFTVGMLVLEAISAPEEPDEARPKSFLLLCAGLYLLATAVGTVLGWPYLWANPWGNLVGAFQTMSHFRWVGPVFYLGDMLLSTQLPWHYIPVWVVVTTPIAYTLAFVAGAAAVLAGFRLRRLLHSRAYRYDVLFLGWAVGPVIIIVALHSVVYDGWRHLYFLYPGFLLLAVGALRALVHKAQQHPAWRLVAMMLLGLGGLEMGLTVIRMVADHPYQNVYFSFLPGPTVERQFERDYWALSNRQAVEWLLAHDPSPVLEVETNDANPIGLTYLMLPFDQRSRLRQSGPTARYFLTNYRGHPANYPASVGREIYCIRAGGMRVLTIFQRY